MDLTDSPECFTCYDLKPWLNRPRKGAPQWTSYYCENSDWYLVRTFLKKLRASISTCDICALVVEALEFIEGSAILDNELFISIDGGCNKPTAILYDVEDENRMVELYTCTVSDKDKAESISIRSALQVCPNMDSALAAKIVRPWLDECVSSHDACRSRQRSHLPKRVISVGSHDHAPCLYESHGEESDYIALSYCWGLGRSLTTTKSSYAARVTGISWEDFPNTIRDAMIFTQNIGVQFIWIDALCIIQDDAEDWRVEAAKMASIYENALLTLSATASDSTNSGCFPTPRAKSHKLSKQLSSPFGSVDVYARLSFHHAHNVLFEYGGDGYIHDLDELIREGYPVLTRGWIFQERVLSSRTVHCAPGELLWECISENRCECSATAHDREGRNALIKFKGLTRDGRPIDDRSPAIQLWTELIQSYSRRLFTYPTDKLVALSGAAQKFQRLDMGLYLAGLWRQDLHVQLCWYRASKSDPESRRINQPSWSWASINQPCFFATMSMKTTPLIQKFEVLEAETELCGSDRMGGVSSGRIVASAPTVKASIHLQTAEASSDTALDVMVKSGNHYFKVVTDVCQWKTGSKNWDNMQSSERMVEGDAVLCAGLFRAIETGSGGRMPLCRSAWLVLQPSEVQGVFKRVGIINFSTHSIESADKQSPETIDQYAEMGTFEFI